MAKSADVFIFPSAACVFVRNMESENAIVGMLLKKGFSSLKPLFYRWGVGPCVRGGLISGSVEARFRISPVTLFSVLQQ